MVVAVALLRIQNLLATSPAAAFSCRCQNARNFLVGSLYVVGVERTCCVVLDNVCKCAKIHAGNVSSINMMSFRENGDN